MAEFTLYALIFHDAPGPGYVLMSQLTGGNNGFVFLVRSLLDGELYVRKQLTTSANKTVAEVTVLHHIPITCSMPRLISSHRCRRYNDENMPTADIHSLFFQFCNGGNLAMFLENFWQESRPIPEVFIWHFVAKMVEILAGLQLGWTKRTAFPIDQSLQPRAAVYHADLHGGNIFLNWPSSHGILPEIFLGDFGNALILPSDGVESAGSLLDDVATFGLRLMDLVDTYNVQAFNFNDENDEQVGNWKGRFPASYSLDLFRWCDRLTTDRLPTAQEMVTHLLPLAERNIAELLLPLHFDPDAVRLLRWTQPRLPDRPFLLHETEKITSRSILAPLQEVQDHWHFCPVAVSEATFDRVHSIEARELHVALSHGYERFPLADGATACRCPGPNAECHSFRRSRSGCRHNSYEHQRAVDSPSEPRRHIVRSSRSLLSVSHLIGLRTR